MNNRGFLLLDSLVNVLIVCLLCVLCFVIYDALSNYEDGYQNYIDESNMRYEDLFNGLGECEKCIVVENKDS